jgi:phenylacetate-CoA ligase
LISKENSYFNPKAETKPRADIEEEQSKLLKQTFQIASENSIFYKQYFKRLQVDSAPSIEDLQKRKFFTTKEDLRLNYPYGMLAIPRTKVVEMHATSGTTGTPTLSLHSERDLEDWGEIAARSLVMSGLEKDDVFQITPSLGMFSGGFGFYHGCRKVGATIVPSSSGFSKRQIQYMIDFGTTMFSAIVSYAFRLAEVANEMGIDPKKDTKVRKGVFGSEIWTREMKTRLANIWDMEPYDIYGFTELYGPGVGNDCKMHDGLHIWEDFFVVEVIDPKTGEVIGPEEEGELVFTTLRKEAMPLIRYRSRDMSLLLDSTSCDCGRTHRRYREIRARSDDMIKISGVNFWPSEIESLILKEKGLGPEYRIKISKEGPLDHLIIEIESNGRMLKESEKEELSTKLVKDLRDRLFFSPEVVIVDPNTLPRVEVGKVKRISDER